MERKGYVFEANDKVKVEGCFTCRYSRLRERKEGEKAPTSNFCSSRREVLPDGSIKITSNCSGIVTIYK